MKRREAPFPDRKGKGDAFQGVSGGRVGRSGGLANLRVSRRFAPHGRTTAYPAPPTTGAIALVLLPAEKTTSAGIGHTRAPYIEPGTTWHVITSPPALFFLPRWRSLLPRARRSSSIRGEWQDTETGTENGQAVKPEVNSDCLSPEEAKDPVKSLMAMKGQSDGQCKTMDVKQSGNTVSFVMQCGDPKQMSFDIAATYIFIDRRHYTGTMKSTIIMAGQKTTSDKKIESKWIGACKK